MVPIPDLQTYRYMEYVIHILDGMPVAFQQADNFARVLEIVGNQLQLLFLEKLGKALFYAFARGHIILPFLFFDYLFGDEAFLKLLAPVFGKSGNLFQVFVPNGLIQRIFLVHPFLAGVVRLGLLHEVGEGVTHSAFAHLDGEIVGDPGPFRLDDFAIVELELVLAFHGTSIILVKDGGGALVIAVHELAVNAVEHLVFGAYGDRKSVV